MCGLAGIVDASKRLGASHAHAMARAIAHRGPDDHTDWSDPEWPVHMSFRRLAIIDTTAHANQPMHHGPLTLCFNGEIYNYKELRAQLESQHGCSFQTKSDTEVLLQGFMMWGVAGTLQKVNGMYGIALLDRRDGTLTLARDRFGEKPLYYTQSSDAFLFASELKAIRAVEDLLLDRESVDLYLRYGFIPAPRTIHKDVSALKPGEWRTYKIEGLECIAEGTIERASENPEHTDFASCLTRAIEIRLRSDVPVGVFLSGGIDSSLILYLATQELGRSLPSFTIRMKGADPAYDEAPQAQQIAALCGSDNYVLDLSERMLLDALPAQIEMMDQPLGDAAILPTALLSKMAREQVTVILGGEGGDELQAGYTRHIQQKKMTKLLRNKWGRQIVQAAKPLAGLGPLLNMPQLPRQLDKMERLYDLYRGDAYDAVMSQWPVKAPRPRLPGYFREADAAFYLPNDLLMKLDGATMSASLEGRCPYLDPDLWACVNAMPRSLWEGKRLAKSMLRTMLPSDALPTAKRGLTLPLAEWLRGDLREWGMTSIRQLKGSGIMPYMVMQQEWGKLQSGRSDHAQPLWTLCVFSAWCAAHKISI